LSGNREEELKMALSNDSFQPKPTAPPIKKSRKKRVGKIIEKKVDSPRKIVDDSVVQNGNEIKIEGDTYYWALYCGDPEIILTNYGGTHFYLHGDEHTRKIDNTLLIVKKRIGSRAEMIERIKKKNKEN